MASLAAHAKAHSAKWKCAARGKVLQETIWPHSPRARRPHPQLPVQAFAGFQAGVTARSQLVWGEHCTECSFPACQFTCAFYTPRADLICQRFEHGIETVACDDVQVSRVGFRKWGKLEASGPAPLVPVANSRRLDGLDSVVSAAILKAPLGFETKQRWLHGWNRRKNRLSRRAEGAAARFVVEAWSPGEAAFEMTVTFLGAGDERMFQRAFTVSREYRRLEIPACDIARAVDLDAPYLVQIEPVGEAEGKDVYFGFIDFVEAAQAPTPPLPAKPGKTAKVVVWDLDNTLWDGTLAEDGIEGLTVRAKVIETIRELDRRGILNSVASKNDAPLAHEALAHFGIDHLFLAPHIGWGPKSDAIAAIAASLDLGLDSFLFVDDQAFERAQVQAALPMIEVLSDVEAVALVHNPRCDLPVTAESARRREMYLEEGLRQSAFDGQTCDYTAFVASCEIRLEIAPLGPGNAERVFELSQRTNQLNFRGTRYTRDDVARLAASPASRGLVLSCRDRFGDYGIIGFLELDLTGATVRDFFMSCRVQRKFVEHALFQHLLERVHEQGHTALDVLYRASPRNGMAARLLESLEFAPAANEADTVRWSRPSAVPIANAGLVRIETRQETDADAR